LEAAKFRGDYSVSVPVIILKALIDATERELERPIVVSGREVP
jgi:hypothetical protein